MAICDRGGLPIAVHVASASPYEPHLVPATLDARFLPDLPWCLIGDRGYDSDGLDDLLMTQYGIEMIAANRRGRAKTQDGRPLRRAKRRWKIERFFAWLHNCRRVVTRWERHVENYLGMVRSLVPASCFGPQSDSLRRPDGSTVGDYSLLQPSIRSLQSGPS
jgi:transposase